MKYPWYILLNESSILEKKKLTQVAGIFANLNKQKFNSARICLEHQHGHRLNVLKHQLMATMPSRENALILFNVSLESIYKNQNDKMKVTLLYCLR